MGNSKSNIHDKDYHFKCLHTKKERMKLREVSIDLQKCETRRPTKQARKRELI